VIVVGAGGHARVVIDVLRASGYEVTGCLSSDGSASGALDVPVLGRDTELEERIQRGETDVFIAVGDNAARIRLARHVLDAGGRLATAVSPRAEVSPSARLGPGTLLMPGAVVNAGTVLGLAVIVNTNASIDHDCTVGDGVHVAPGVAVAGGVTIGSEALVGIGASIAPGVTIGAGCVVGAGSAVVGDVPDGVTVAGVPARALGSH